MVKVLVVGQTPPPYSGQAIMIERFVKSDLAGVQIVHVRLAFFSHMNNVGAVRVGQIIHMFAIILRMIYHRFANGVRVLYYPPAGPDRVPMWRDIIILTSTRWLFDKTVFHFRAGGISDLYVQLPSWQQWLFRRAYFGADAAIRLSDLNPEDGMVLQAKRHYVVPNGLDDPCPGLVVPPSDTTRPSDDPVRILFVGILRESKGVMVLIEACGKLAERGVPLQLELMGQWQSEAFAEQVRERIEELNLTRQVHFLGVQLGDAKYATYRQADVLCFPTFYNCETFGNVLIEAMACGLPVVSTRWRGVPSIVHDGETGFLVGIQDAEAVAERLELLAGDADLRWQMGTAGRVKFEREFVYKIHANRMRAVLLDVAGESLTDEPDLIGNSQAPLQPWSAASVYNSESEKDAVAV